MLEQQGRIRARGRAYLGRFMSALDGDREKLKTIQSEYDNLSLLGQLLSDGADVTDIGAMRADFNALASSLLDQLATELEAKAESSLRSKARVAIDILIRNLFERTADIGFLATDAELRAHAQAHALDPLAAAADHAARAALLRRFEEYQRKYSVYHDIVLLAPDGTILARLRDDVGGGVSGDALVRASLHTEQAYCETFRASDLLPHEASPLIYSYRVQAVEGGATVGVLCLCFRFDDECQRIFSGLIKDDDWTVVTILDAEATVIASSDAHQFPPGAKLERVLGDSCRVVRFAGREYLATTQPTQGYQGYRGPGWMGHALIPLNHAFEMAVGAEIDAVPAAALEGVIRTSNLFSPALRAIPERAETIQLNLDRAVWNGSAWLSRADAALNTSFAKVLLREIGSTGARTREVFSASTRNLYETVISSVLVDCAQQATLAMDIMDRNLYERANDCRWWALTGAFASALADGEADVAELGAILRGINGLYTVYTNLLVFDAEAKVLAVSNPSASELAGAVLQAEWVRRTLALADSQSYCVSAFEPSALYGGRPTYVYCAAIRDPANSARVTGGVAIVFDAEPQFAAMLRDALPRDDDAGVVDGSLAAFVGRDGRVVACTDASIAPGALLDVGEAFLRPAAGQGTSNIVAWRGRYYAVGSRVSSGYREYKGPGDAYRNDVVALVLRPLSAELAEIAPRPARPARPELGRRVDSAAELEIATFRLGEHWFALPAEVEIEALDAVRATPFPAMPPWMSGCFMLRGEAVVQVELSHFLPGRETARDDGPTIALRLAAGRAMIAFRVDALGEVGAIDRSRLEPIPDIARSEDDFATELIRPAPGTADGRILVLLDPRRIAARFGSAAPPMLALDTLRVAARRQPATASSG